MLSQGIKEIQIISQDTTRYGTDIYGEPRLIELLETIDTIPGDFTYRVYYLYPDILTLDHLAKLAKLQKFLPYFDIPFQHISENVLRLMGRHYDQKHIFSFLDTIRSIFANSFIRTSFIIGFPGETVENFEELIDFVKKYAFESVGIFQYHDEPLAASSKLPNKVDENTAKERIEILTPVLESIYEEKRAVRRGKKQSGYIMEIGDTSAIIRPEMHAPEVDEYDEIALQNIETALQDI
jgi:ribosomal protein S12 methylthiotransferase